MARLGGERMVDVWACGVPERIAKKNNKNIGGPGIRTQVPRLASVTFHQLCCMFIHKYNGIKLLYVKKTRLWVETKKRAKAFE